MYAVINIISQCILAQMLLFSSNLSMTITEYIRNTIFVSHPMFKEAEKIPCFTGLMV